MRLPSSFPGVLVAVACGWALAAAPAPEPRLLEPGTAEHTRLVGLGQPAADALTRRLSEALLAALAKDGAEAAVVFCRTEALPLTDATGQALPGVTGLKRTSLRVRNPANTPDAAERQALEQVAAQIALGERPVPLAQRLPSADGEADAVRLYYPLFIKPACLTCHGAPDAQPTGLRAALAQGYPDDAALGYRSGEWRGLIRVSLKTPVAPPAPADGEPGR